MSRVKDAKRRSRQFASVRPKGNGKTLHPASQTQVPIAQQLQMLFGGVDRLVEHISEVELMIEFTMRQIKLGRVKPGAITGIDGKMPVEQISLLELFYSQREVFAAQLLKERHEAIQAQRDADAKRTGQSGEAQGDPQAAASEGGSGDAPAAPNTISPGGIILPGKFGES